MHSARYGLPMITILEDQIPDKHELVDLYTSTGWLRYVQKPDDLAKAVSGSTYVVIARQGDQLVGLARCVSDEVSIAYVQDILVRPDFQRQGIGRRLMEAVLARFEQVSHVGLLTDDEPRQHAFYTALGFRNIDSFDKEPLNSYVVFRD